MDTLGPTLSFALLRQGKTLAEGTDLVPFVEDLEVELVDWGLAELRATFNDPDNRLRDSGLFRLGDVVVVTMGWPEHSHTIDAFEVVERRASFGSADSGPQLVVRGLPGPHIMMDVQGKIKGGTTIQDPFAGGKKDRGGTIWGTEKKKTKPSTIVNTILAKYPFHVDISKAAKAKEPEVVVIQPRDVSDWNLLQGLARFLGLTMFWQWHQARGTWVLNWGKNPGDFQQRKYTFQYNAGQDTTLFTPEVEQVKIGQATQVEILVWDNADQVWKMVWVGSGGRGQAYTSDGEVKDNTLLQIRTSGFSVRTITGKPFANVKEAVAMATSYLDAQKRHFWRLRAETVGMETLQPFQRHTIQGLGDEYDGDYRLTTVAHRFDKSGYWTEFQGYKILDTQYQQVTKKVLQA